MYYKQTNYKQLEVAASLVCFHLPLIFYMNVFLLVIDFTDFS